MKLIFVGIIFSVVFGLIGAELIDTHSIEVSGLIECCDHLNKCEPPKKAKIELWDYYKFFPNVLLYPLEIENSRRYSFKWTDGKVFDVKPLLKVHIQCSDGTIFDQTYDSFSNTKQISQDIKVQMQLL
uniref:Uncharacterized protein n=1 Tax=Panagrolaimus sp. PS1159 TaxID=55785 RepID=A0AC35EUG5_9BILA